MWRIPCDKQLPTNYIHMKKIIFLFSAIIFLASCGSNKPAEEKKSGFELKGKLRNANGEQLYLEEMSSAGTRVIDTTTVNETGEFTFSKANPALSFYRLRITDANFAMLILDSTQKVTLTGDARDLGNTFRVEGSPDSQLFWDMNEVSKKSYQKCDSILRSYEAYANLNKGDKVKLQEFNDKAEKDYTAESKRLNDYLRGLISKNPGSIVSIIALQQLTPEYSEDGNIAYYKLVDEALTKKYPSSAQVKSFHDGVVNMLKTAIGCMAPDFSFATPNGKMLSPSSFKGKYLLIDFWASWCAPCRAESPNMVKMYKQFHPKGLEILSISLDEKKDKWIEAIKKDNLEWNHVSDLGGWQSAAAKMYSVSGIPQTFLLDKEGKIIAKGLRAEGLETKLKELFK